MDQVQKLMLEGRFDEARKTLDEAEVKMLTGIEEGWRKMEVRQNEALEEFERHAREIIPEIERMAVTDSGRARKDIEVARAQLEESSSRLDGDGEKARQGLRSQFDRIRTAVDRAELAYRGDPGQFRAYLEAEWERIPLWRQLMEEGSFEDARKALDEDANRNRATRARRRQRWEQSTDRFRRAFNRPEPEFRASLEEAEGGWEEMRRGFDSEDLVADARLERAKAEIADAERRHRPD